MGDFNGEISHALRTKMIVDLLKGKEVAIQLQTLIKNPSEDRGLVSPKELCVQIFKSFNQGLSDLNSSAELAHLASVDSGGNCRRKKLGIRDRRGSYKRRRPSESWEKVSTTTEDGYAWRKYGQKIILNSKYPRCYFRCTHKYEGCKATKQVQITKENPITTYQTTYFNHHTCNNFSHPNLIPNNYYNNNINLISFQSTEKQTHHQTKNPQNPKIIATASEESSKEILENTNDSDYQEGACSFSDEKSPHGDMQDDDPWPEISTLAGVDDYQPQWACSSGFDQSCESTTFCGLDGEVNQIGDLDSFFCFDDHLY